MNDEIIAIAKKSKSWQRAGCVAATRLTAITPTKVIVNVNIAFDNLAVLGL